MQMQGSLSEGAAERSEAEGVSQARRRRYTIASYTGVEKATTLCDHIFSCLDISARWSLERRIPTGIRDDADDGIGVACFLDFITIKT